MHCHKIDRLGRTSLQSVLSAFAVMLTVTVLSFSAIAGNRYWQVATGDWGIHANWGFLEPGSNDTAFIDNDGTANITQSGEAAMGLQLGTTSLDSGHVNMSAGGLSVGEDEFIGYRGVGTFMQTGGTNSMDGSLYLGRYSSGNGAYTLSGALSVELIVDTFSYVGHYGMGAFVQTGGSHSVGSTLTLGKEFSGSGTYDFSGGRISTGALVVGEGGTGVFNQSGGATAVSAGLTVGYRSFNGSSYDLGDGTYNLSGTGVLSSGSALIGVGGTGTFVQSGGTYSVANNVYLGFYSGSPGTYTLSGGTFDVGGSIVNHDGVGTLNIDGGTLNMGGGSIAVDNFNVGVSASGTYTQSSANHTVERDLVLGVNPASNGTYNLNGGSLSSDNAFIGKSGTGAFAQSNGTHTVSFDLFLGSDNGSSGTYDLSGSGTVSARDERIGSDGTGVFTQSGGSNTIADDLILGENSGGSGTYNLSGAGSLIVGEDQYVGYHGTGAVVQTGGTNSVTGLLRLGYNDDGSGTYNLSGAASVELISLLEIIGYRGVGTFTQTGGTNSIGSSLYLGRESGGDGEYNLSGGTIESGAEIIGEGGTGVMNHTGGTNTVRAGLVVGNRSFNGIGYDLGDGTYNLSGTGILSSGTAFIGSGGTGTFVQSGGTYSVASDVYLGFNAGSQGTYTLSGGTFDVGGAFVNDDGVGTLNIDGGTLNMSGGGAIAVDNFNVGVSASGTYTQSSANHTVANDLVLGVEVSGDGTYNLNGGSISSDDAFVGKSGAGVFTQSGGSNTITNSMYLGQNSGSSGTYNLSGAGTLSVGASQYVGYHGAGAVVQTGGTNSVTGSLYMGFDDDDGGGGTYSLSGDASVELIVDRVYLGFRGAGEFTQTGGSVVTTSINVAAAAGSEGWYSLSGGTVSADREVVGIGGTGVMNHSGGTNTTTSRLIIGDWNWNGSSFDPGNGFYSLSGTGVLSVGSEYIGYGGSGAFVQSGGTNTVAGDLYMGFRSGGTGIYTLSGGSLNVGGDILNQDGTGTLILDGGTLNMSGGGSIDVDHLKIGISAPSSFVQSVEEITVAQDMTLGNTMYALSGGVLDVGGDIVNAGGVSKLQIHGGTLDMSGGGTIDVDHLRVGLFGGAGSYTMEAGETVNVGSGEYIGYSGEGVFVQNGGTHTVSLGVYVGYMGSGSGVFEMYGGDLDSGFLTIALVGSGTFTQHGGTHTTNSLSVDVNGGGGTYNLIGGILDVLGSEVIGTRGAGGLFAQSGGTHAVSQDLQLGSAEGSRGTYNHTGGTNTVSGDLSFGEAVGSDGTYNLSGTAVLEVEGDIYGSGFGVGTLNIDGGTLDMSGGGSIDLAGFNVGFAPGSVGSYTLVGGRALTAVTETLGSSGNGSLTQTGGTHTLTDLYIGGSNVTGGGPGLLDISGGQIDVGDTIKLWASGTLRVSGSAEVTAMSLDNSQGGTIDFTGGLIIVGGGAFSNPTPLVMDGPDNPTLRLVNSATGTIGGALFVGSFDDGALDVSNGGQISSAGGSIASDGGSTGLAMVTGADSSWTSTSDLHVGGSAGGAGGTGELTVADSGLVDVTGVLKLYSDGTLNINGGTVRAGTLENDGGTLNFVSGLLAINGNMLQDANSPLGLHLMLGPGRNLSVGGTMTIGVASIVTLNGGKLSATNLDVSGTLDFQSGILELLGGDLTALDTMLIPRNGTLRGSGTAHSPVAGMVGSNIDATGDLTLGDATRYDGFVHEGTLSVGSHTVTLNTKGFANLGILTELDGGTLAGGNGVIVGLGDNLTGRGRVDAKVAAGFGSIIEATGDLALGDADAFDGFQSDGSLVTGVHTITINDRNQAVLGSLTQLGTDTDDGTLVADNGLIVEFGKNIVGRGLVDTPNDVLTPLTNNGDIIGDSPVAIELAGYVKGVGTLTNVTVSGTLSPGFSPVRMYASNIEIGSGGELVMELGGLSGGSEYDQLDVAGDLTLGGRLQVSLIDGFTPGVGDAFDILDFDSLGGSEFDAIELPELAGRKVWDTSDLYTTGVINVVGMLGGDTDADWDVDADDYDAFVSEFGGAGNWRTDFNEDGRVDLYDFVIMRANFGVSIESSPGAAETTATPEPATLSLLALGGLVMFRRRNCRTK
jgi:T5SS/PEP-CTERM-associated repeat protein